MLKYIIIIPSLLIGQIEKQIRNDDPSLYKNQRVYHAPPKPLYKARTHDLDFLTDIPTDSVKSAILFFKTDSLYFPMITVGFWITFPDLNTMGHQFPHCRLEIIVPNHTTGDSGSP